MKPYFTLVVPHYQGVINDDTFYRFLLSLKENYFRELEVIILHDGELLQPLSERCEALIQEMGVDFNCTVKRYNDWGHTLRDYGLRMAEGEYILHTNADNKVGDLQGIRDLIKEDEDDIYIFPCVMKGTKIEDNRVYRTYDEDDSFILAGNPKSGVIDVMQLVMKKKTWIKEGGWYCKEETSDGIMYPLFCEKYGYTQCKAYIIGEHY